MTYKVMSCLKLVGAMLICSHVWAQGSVDTMIQLNGAIQLAQQRYHLLQARKYEADAAIENIEVAKYSRLPSIDASYQAGFATANNLTGVFYPNGLLPMSGPPSLKNNYSPAAGSAASLLLNWQAVTFGTRNAQINVSIAEADMYKSAFAQDLFRHTINVISSYLDLLLAYDMVSINERNVERVQVNLQQSRVLTKTGLRPGVDTALLTSELSKAKIEWLNAQKKLQTGQWLLAQLIVTDVLPIPTDTTFLQNLPNVLPNNDTSFVEHPIIRYARTQVQLSQSKELLFKKTWRPAINVWGSAFARGSGFLPDGSIKTWDGLGLSRYNYSAGLQLAFPILKYVEVKRQLQQQTFLSKASEERLKDEVANLATQQHLVNTAIESSMKVAVETAQQLKSAHYAFNAMQIRYNTGLANFSDLIQAEYNLLRAELEMKQSYWDAWKALLLQAAVKGDLNVFLKEIK